MSGEHVTRQILDRVKDLYGVKVIEVRWRFCDGEEQAESVVLAWDDFLHLVTATRRGLMAESRNEHNDSVDHPSHYNTIPGVECIDVVEHLNFNIGNAIKYLWRAGHKGDLVEDLQKARWYIEREIARVSR